MSFFKTIHLQFIKQQLFFSLYLWFSRVHPLCRLKKFHVLTMGEKRPGANTHRWDKSERCRVPWGLENQMQPSPDPLFGYWLQESWLETAACFHGAAGIWWEPCVNVSFLRDGTGEILGRESRINTDADTRKFRQYWKNSWTQTPRDHKSNVLAIQVKAWIYLFHKYLLNTHS